MTSMRGCFICILLLLNPDYSHNVPLRSRQDESSSNETETASGVLAPKQVEVQVHNQIFCPDINQGNGNFLTIDYGFDYKNLCSDIFKDIAKSTIENNLLDIINYLTRLEARYFTFINELLDKNYECIEQRESTNNVILEVDFSCHGTSTHICDIDDNKNTYLDEEYSISIEDEQCIEQPVSVDFPVEYTTILDEECEEDITSTSSTKFKENVEKNVEIVAEKEECEEQSTSTFKPLEWKSVTEEEHQEHISALVEDCKEQTTYAISSKSIDVDICEEQSTTTPLEIIPTGNLESLEEICIEQFTSTASEPAIAEEITVLPEPLTFPEEECEEQMTIITPSTTTEIITADGKNTWSGVIESSEEQCVEQVTVATPTPTIEVYEWCGEECEEQLTSATQATIPAYFIVAEDVVVTEMIEPLTEESIEEDCIEQLTSTTEATSKIEVTEFLEQEYYESPEEMCEEQIISTTEPSSTPFSEFEPSEEDFESLEEECQEQHIIKLITITEPVQEECEEEMTTTTETFVTEELIEYFQEECEEQLISTTEITPEEECEEYITSTTATSITPQFQEYIEHFEQECEEQLTSTTEKYEEELIYTTEDIIIIPQNEGFIEQFEEECEEQLISTTDMLITPEYVHTTEQTIIESTELVQEHCEEQMTYTVENIINTDVVKDESIESFEEESIEQPTTTIEPVFVTGIIESFEEECEEQSTTRSSTTTEFAKTVEEFIYTEEKCEEQLPSTTEAIIVTELIEPEEQCIEQITFTNDPFHEEVFEEETYTEETYKVLNISIKIKEQDECVDATSDQLYVPTNLLDFDVTYNPDSLEDIITAVDKNVKCYNCIDTDELHVKNEHKKVGNRDEIFLKLLRYLAEYKYDHYVSEDGYNY